MPTPTVPASGCAGRGAQRLEDPRGRAHDAVGAGLGRLAHLGEDRAVGVERRDRASWSPRCRGPRSARRSPLPPGLSQQFGHSGRPGTRVATRADPAARPVVRSGPAPLDHDGAHRRTTISGRRCASRTCRTTGRPRGHAPRRARSTTSGVQTPRHLADGDVGGGGDADDVRRRAGRAARPRRSGRGAAPAELRPPRPRRTTRARRGRRASGRSGRPPPRGARADSRPVVHRGDDRVLRSRAPARPACRRRCRAGRRRRPATAPPPRGCRGRPRRRPCRGRR